MGSIGYVDIGSGLGDVTICYGLGKCMVREAREGDDVTLDASAMDLEIQDHIMSGPAEAEHELVIAAAANQRVVADATDDDVVTGTAVQSEPHRCSRQFGRIDKIVAGAGLDRKKVSGFRMVDGHLRRQTADRDHAAGGCYGDAIFTRRAVDGHAVRLAVATAAWCRQINGDLLHAGAGEVVDRGVVGAA